MASKKQLTNSMFGKVRLTTKKRTMNSYEKNINLMLQRLLSIKAIKDFSFEPFSFIMLDKPLNTYKPDFVITNLDGTHLIIEIKGFMRGDGRGRFCWCASVNPDKRFMMIVKKAGKWSVKYDINKESASCPFDFER